jgi:hypothetical protein
MSNTPVHHQLDREIELEYLYSNHDCGSIAFFRSIGANACDKVPCSRTIVQWDQRFKLYLNGSSNLIAPLYAYLVFRLHPVIEFPRLTFMKCSFVSTLNAFSWNQSEFLSASDEGMKANIINVYCDGIDI